MNFKILTVNGRDLSGASHEVAANAFQNASEPITVVLRRSGSKTDVTERISPPVSPRSDAAISGKINSSTQTQDESCFCRFLLQNSAKLSSPLASLINELLTYREENLNNINQESSGESYRTEEDDDVFRVDYEEVVLKRTSKEEKLGLILHEHLDIFSNQIQVVVTNVSSHSIAARCQKIHEGDHIVKINGFPVSNMNEASRLLRQDSPLITFVVGHPHFTDDEAVWHDEDRVYANDCFENDDPLRDVTNCTGLPVDDARVPVYLEHRRRDGCKEHAKKLSQKLTCDANGTTESGMSNRSTGSSNQTGKDSGIGHTMDSSIQSATENISRATNERLMFGTGSSDCASHSLAREFTFVPPQNYRFNKRTPQRNNGVVDSADSAKGSMERSASESMNGFQKLNDAVRNLELENKKNQTPPQHYSMEESNNEHSEIVSPWVKIARQDYEDKIRQLEKNGDIRALHPALTPGTGNLNKVVEATTSSRSPSIATDNTSSAYSTGESFRSSSTASASRSVHKVQSPPSFPSRHEKLKEKSHAAGVTMTYYMSSDANSDGEGPACYLTHNEESESEGFEDAGLEFSSVLTPAPSSQSKPVPLPRILHPPHETTNFMSSPLTTSTKQLCNAAAAVAKNRRLESNLQFVSQTELPYSPEILQQQSQRCRSPTRHRSGSRSTTTSSKDRSESETIVPANCGNSGGESTCTNVVNETDFLSENKLCSRVAKTPETSQMTSREKCIGPKVRRSSDSSYNKKKRPVMNRSLSCAESSTAKDKDTNRANTNCSESSQGEVQMEWKVRVSKDGTRYITKRPVREKVLRHREKRILAERCGITTDDDVTELKLGRHWTREERKRHLRHAREKKRRRDFMQRCRLEVLNESANAEGDIVELSHKKMTKQKHKRMLLDNFFTVQEILAHGDRTNGVTSLNPLLNVTYI